MQVMNIQKYNYIYQSNKDENEVRTRKEIRLRNKSNVNVCLSQSKADIVMTGFCSGSC